MRKMTARRDGSDATDELLREVRGRLALADQRMTRGRRALLELFLRAKRPLAASELIDAAAGAVPQSSLYRSLAVLCDAGVLRRLNFDEGFVRYELDHDMTEHHHHLVCSRCNAVVDLDERTLATVEAALEKAEAAIRRSRGFTVEEHQLDLRGFCRTCA